MGWIMTVEPIKTGIAWSTEYIDISGVLTTSSESDLTDVQASCTNTDTITKQGDNSKYPAAWAAKNYKPTGTPSGKSWCLPSGGLLKDSLNNSIKFPIINAGITIAGGTILGNASNGYEFIWSSTEYSNPNAWSFNIYTSNSSNMNGTPKYNYDSSHSVRPVMPF